MSTRLLPLETAVTQTRTDSFRAVALALAAVFLALPAAARADEANPLAAPPATPAAAASGPKTAAQAEALDPISGVKLGLSGPRQEAHVLIRRRERAEGKNEISLNESIEVNGKFTEQLGTGLDWAYHLREAFAFGLGGTWYERAVESSFTEDELITKARQEPLTASALLLQWEAHAGVELSPIYGKFAWFDSGVVQFGFYLGSALGVADTRVQLRSADPNTGRDRTFGETGLKPIGLFNAGFRLFFSEHIAVRAEIRDTVYSDSVQTINGCTSADLDALTGNDPTHVGASCNAAAFPSVSADGPIADQLVKTPSSDVLNNIAFNAALSVLF